MEDGFSVKGGAKIGLLNATWPFATLKITNETIILNVKILGKYTFSLTQIQRIEKVVHIPILGWGLRIYHNVPDYPEKIIFWCFANPQKILDKIQEIKFSPGGETGAVVKRGYPVRWQAIVAILAIYGGLLFLDQDFSLNSVKNPGFYSVLAVVLVFIGSLSIWKVRCIQKLILKPGRSPNEIRHWLYLLSFVSGFLATLLLFMIGI